MNMNHKLFSILTLVLCLSVSAWAQTHLVQVKSSQTKKWGYANQKGELVIPAEYAKCYEFTPDGLATVQDPKTKQYQFINAKGEALPVEIKNFQLISAFGFDVQGFAEGFVPVKVNGKWGYLNKEGKLAIAAQYDKVLEFTEGHAAVKKGDAHFIIDTKGTETPVANVLDIKRFSEGLAPYVDAAKKTGFINTQGKIVIPAQFESVGYFKAGLAWARTADKKIGFITKTGEWAIQPKFDVAKDFDASGSYARVRTGDAWSYTNAKGELFYVKDTQQYGDYANGLASGKRNDKMGFYNTKGEWVIEPRFENVREFKNGFASVKDGDKWGVINTKGEWVIQPQFEAIKDMELTSGRAE
jgi:hypothetical protein